jgi:deoxyhypusine synthase
MTTKRELLRDTVEHIDIKSFDSTPIIESMKKMSFSSRDTANAAEILLKMIRDKECTNMLTIAGSTSAGGCMQVYVDMIKHNMIDVIVATGASIIDMDFFEAIGYKHYIGRTDVPDKKLRDFYIDRIYDTFIDEDDLQMCDGTIKLVADKLERRPYSSREFIHWFRLPLKIMFPSSVLPFQTAVQGLVLLNTSGKTPTSMSPLIQCVISGNLQ